MIPTFNEVQGLIFDYGGTLDTGGVHWSEVLWEAYRAAQVGVDKAQFREAYVHGERTLAREYLIRPEHTFLDVLRIKVDIETAYLVEQGWWQPSPAHRGDCVEHIAQQCYLGARRMVAGCRPVLAQLSVRYPLALVSNFYGNITTILRDFQIDDCFSHVIESAVVGVRKPNPAIFQLGVTCLGLSASQVAVVGDSYAKDIWPATQTGCLTVWLRGKGWAEEQVDETVPTAIIHSFGQLVPLLL